MKMSEKKAIVVRLVDEELRGWRAGWEAGATCAKEWLTIKGFGTVSELEDPNFKQLQSIFRDKGQPKWAEDNFWTQLAGAEFEKVVHLPDFGRAFVASVREVWEEIREEVLREVEACPGRASDCAEVGEQDAEEMPGQRRRRTPRRSRSFRWDNQRRFRAF